ncbi:hypothetical protein IHE26_02015 [Plesiomonas shigelloides]|uniref:hypothetical protein n=1 Tax=Plesiomonas shigelloides TaxID=703 RepID=UPI00177E4975|nr:hypothetical protein [Plesiomonas shigelloides]MDT1012014.1 hypothetical protein [Plesiomonas shigelloides]QOH80125.1 hypothetical protein IHE26_02015 [Plesiomonas shigelloides]
MSIKKKLYQPPKTSAPFTPTLMAAPLAFFSVATAAAAVVGAVAGAAATSKAMSVTPDCRQGHSLPEIKGLYCA